MKKTSSQASAPSLGMSARTKTVKTPAPVEDGLVSVQCDVLDPSLDGSALAEGVMEQAARDCAQFVAIAFLEPKGLAFMGEEDTVLRHRLVLVCPAHELDVVLGHLTAYAQMFWVRHPVLVTVLRTSGFLRTLEIETSATRSA